jgi:hypothetical protein
MNWARDRSTLWNAAERAGRRNDARLAKEVIVFLPSDLSPSRCRELALTFARQLADRYQNAVDLAVHQPRPGSDERHHHAHLLSARPRSHPWLERLEKADDLLFLILRQIPEPSDHVLRLTLVSFDGILQCQRPQVMHEAGAHAQAPKRRRAQLVGCVLWSRLHDSISGLDVMQQEVTVRMNDLVAQRFGYDEGSTVDNRSRAGRSD